MRNEQELEPRGDEATGRQRAAIWSMYQLVKWSIGGSRGILQLEDVLAYCAVRNLSESPDPTAQSAGRVRGGAAARPSR